MENKILELKQIDKRFQSVHALKQVTLDIYQGETLALVGENGAGKTTLMKVLTGAYSKDSGSICLEGKEVEITNPQAAKNLGISQIYQRVEIIPELSVAENIFMGEKGFGKKGLVSLKHFYEEAWLLLNQYGIEISVKTPMKNLSVAECQLVSIVKVLQRKPKIVIFDEPTAVLSDKEVEILFQIIRKLQKEKTTIIYISHRLEEIFMISNRIAVMRDGSLVKVLKNENITNDDLIVHMLGRKLETMFPEKRHLNSKQEVLRVENLTTDKVKDISFVLYKGEILGMVGLVGSGRTELVKALYGMEKIHSGKIFINGKEVSIKSPRDSIRHGMFMAPEDRKGEGIVPERSVKENITYSKLFHFTKFGIIRKKKEKAHAEKMKQDIHIKAPDIEALSGNLSGGNQQKVVVAKALTANPEILLFDEPTQGIDVGAKAEIYELIHQMAEEGVAILVISSEMEEAIGISKRLLIMREGKLTGEIAEEIQDRKKILDFMYRSDGK